MKLKTKLSLGLGFLFAMIFTLTAFSSYYLQELSWDADNILKDNYNSIVYAKNMLVSLDTMFVSFINNDMNRSVDRMKRFQSGRGEFEKNLKAENNNITEENEKAAVEELKKNYSDFTTLCSSFAKGTGDQKTRLGELLPAYDRMRHDITSIHDINMQAIVLKSRATGKKSAAIIKTMASIGVMCVIIAFGYFWYFPFYISNSIAYVADRMKKLIDGLGVSSVASHDELLMILQSIELLEDTLLKEKRTSRVNRV